MKYHHLERVKVRLKTKSPLHIGSGTKIRKAELIYDNQTRRLYMPSMHEMLQFFAVKCHPKTLEAYEQFLQSNAMDDLGTFLRGQSVRLKPLPEWISRSIRTGNDVRRINEISLFVCNAEGRAYIPGSSIKGALRTALIAHSMTPAEKKDFIADKGNAKPPIEECVLRKLKSDDRNASNAVNDLLRGLEVSDSAAFDFEDMVVCQQQTVSASNSNIKSGRIPTFKECIAPNAETCFYVTLDYTILPRTFLNELLCALKNWDELCYRCYDRYYKNNGIEMADTACKNGTPLRLGGGTGFQNHSMVYAASDNPQAAKREAEIILEGKYRNTYKPQGASTAPYMQKVTSCDGYTYTMGRCEITME